MSKPPHSNTLAGWREWVQLPDVGIPWIKAKLDTGARTSSIHAFDQTLYEHEGAEWVRFRVQPWQESTEDAVVVECPVHDRRHVRSSSGHVEERIVVRMRVTVVGRTVRAEFTLSNRDQMGFRMLLGRQLLRRGFVVAAGESFVGGRAPRETRRRNRGRPA